MKIVNHIRLILGVLNLLGSIILLLFLLILYFQEEVNEGYLAFFLVITYLVLSVIYTILNLSSKEELTAIRQLKEENIELDLKIQQMALRHRIEKLNENKD